MILTIINNCLKRIEEDITKLHGFGNIDLFDFFPVSEEHQKELERQARQISVRILESVRGNFYKFNKPIKTKYGFLEFFKIRNFDAAKSGYEGAFDFVISDWDKFCRTYDGDERFTYIEKDTFPEYKGYKFQTQESWICFLNPPIREILKINK